MRIGIMAGAGDGWISTRWSRRPQRARGGGLRELLAGEHLLLRRDHGARGDRPRDAAASSSAPRWCRRYPRHPARDRAAGAHGERGHRRALHARHRPLAPDRDRGHVRALLRAARAPHGRVPRGADAAAARRAGRAQGRGVPGARRAVQVPGGAPVPLLVAALGPALLRPHRPPRRRHHHLDDRREDARRATPCPTLRKAAEEAGRPAPRVVAGLPIALVRDAAAARETASKQFAIYGQLPSYRAMLDREGAADAGRRGDRRRREGAARAGSRGCATPASPTSTPRWRRSRRAPPSARSSSSPA